MPNLWTHAWMGHAVIGDRKLLSDEEKFFYLGTMGPDFFYYYHVFPWQSLDNKSVIHNIGNLIHNEKVNDFFDMMIHSAKDKNYQSYIKGLLCHFALDTMTHPFIYYYTGVPNAKENDYKHRKMESYIDSLLFEAENMENSLLSYPYFLVTTTHQQREQIWKWYKDIIFEIYHIHLSQEDVEQCWKDCYNLQSLINDPTGKLDCMMGKVEHMLHQSLDVRSVIIPQRHFYDKYDLLNLSHQTWHHPVTGEAYTKSFIDLLKEAIVLGKKLVDQVEQYFEGQLDKELIIQLIGDRSYDTGVSGVKKMQYFYMKE